MLWVLATLRYRAPYDLFLYEMGMSRHIWEEHDLEQTVFGYLLSIVMLVVLDNE